MTQKGSGGGGSPSGGSKADDPVMMPSTGGTGPDASGGAGSESSSGGDGSGGGDVAGGPVLIEEQEAGFCGVDGVIESTNAGFSGAGYANTDNRLGVEIEWAVVSSVEQTRTVTFRYAATGDRPAQLLLDGVKTDIIVDFPDTGDFTTWTEVTAQLDLVAGENRIILKATTTTGLPNIDTVQFEGDGLQATTCEREQMSGGPVTVWIAGDSTVANGNTPCPTGWGAFFGDQLSDQVTVNNWAVGGRSVRTWLYDVSDQMGGDNECVLNTDGSGQAIIQSRWTDMLSQMKEGDYLFIQFGINDGDTKCPRHVGTEQFKEEYIYMAQEAISRGVQPVLITPVSAIKCSGSTAVASRGFLTETKSVGQQLSVPVIDLHQLSIDLYNQLGFCPVPGGDVSASTTGPVGDFFCDDHTHFSDAGAQRMAELMAQAVKGTDLPLASELK